MKLQIKPRWKFLMNLLLRLRKINLLSFAVKVPNAETIGALRQARSGEGLTEYADLESLKARYR